MNDYDEFFKDKININKAFQFIPLSCIIADFKKLNNNNEIEDCTLHHISLLPDNKICFNVPLINFDNFED